MKILLIEDDLALRANLAAMLGKEGYEIAECGNGDEGLYYMANNTCDLVVLDRMLPEMDGLSVLREARKADVKTPVLMLTALNAIGDRVDGLDAGADDYLAKPFDMREFLARVRALARRPSTIENMEQLAVGDIELVPSTCLLTGPKGESHLSKRLSALLELFMRSSSPTLNRSTLFNRIWGPDADVDDSIIESYIFLLRRRLKTVGAKTQIITNRGVGYSLSDESSQGKG